MQGFGFTPVPRLHLEKALGRMQRLSGAWASNLETSCLIYQDGTDGTKLENKH